MAFCLGRRGLRPKSSRMHSLRGAKVPTEKCIHGDTANYWHKYLKIASCFLTLISFSLTAILCFYAHFVDGEWRWLARSPQLRWNLKWSLTNIPSWTTSAHVFLAKGWEDELKMLSVGRQQLLRFDGRGEWQHLGNIKSQFQRRLNAAEWH